MHKIETVIPSKDVYWSGTYPFVNDANKAEIQGFLHKFVLLRNATGTRESSVRAMRHKNMNNCKQTNQDFQSTVKLDRCKTFGNVLCVIDCVLQQIWKTVIRIIVGLVYTQKRVRPISYQQTE